jgi:heme oxygenase
MRERTRRLHARAERSGVVAALLHGTATRAAYAMLLRNLMPVYRVLEHELLRRSESLTALAERAVFRADRMEGDLEALCGPSWRTLPLLEAGARYVECVGTAGATSAARLAAHAYVRFLGDLNGGRMMRGVLERSLELPPAALAFYDFPDIADLPRFRGEYRAAFDRLALTDTDRADALDESARAFELNIELSVAVGRAAHAQP